MLGGGSRSDIQSLAFLRPVTVVVLALGCFGVSKSEIAGFRYLWLLVGSILALLTFHLIPLPPSLLIMLPGSETAAEVFGQAGIDSTWRPLSLAPLRTWNSFFAVIGPLAMLILLLRCPINFYPSVLLVIIVMALFSGIIGLIQLRGASGSLYFYAISNKGSALGLMANRNHNALLLATLFPMLAVYASTSIKSSHDQKMKLWFAISSGLFVVPMLLVTGSRGGVALGLIGIISGLLLYRWNRRSSGLAKIKTGGLNPLMGFGLITIVTIVLGALFVRAQTLSRLFATDIGGELRYQTFRPIAQLAYYYFPVGSGMGTFDEVFRLAEPYDSLSSGYLNHAHNDWLELFLNGGLAAGVIMLSAFIMWLRATRIVLGSKANTSQLAYGQLGVVIILMIGISSIFDYPLRVPSITLIFVVSAFWTAYGANPPSTGIKTDAGQM